MQCCTTWSCAAWELSRHGSESVCVCVCVKERDIHPPFSPAAPPAPPQMSGVGVSGGTDEWRRSRREKAWRRLEVAEEG